VPDRVNWAACIWLVVSSQKLFQLNLRLETNHSIASLADKKKFFLGAKDVSTVFTEFWGADFKTAVNFSLSGLVFLL